MLKHTCGAEAFVLGSLNSVLVSVYLKPFAGGVNLEPITVRESGRTELVSLLGSFFCPDCYEQFGFGDLLIKCELSGKDVPLEDCRTLNLKLDGRVTNLIVDKDVDMVKVREHFKEYVVDISNNFVITLEKN